MFEKRIFPLGLGAATTYLKLSRGNSCPFCGCDTIEGAGYNTFDDFIEEVVTCAECEEAWTDIYTLTGVGVEEEDGDHWFNMCLASAKVQEG